MSYLRTQKDYPIIGIQEIQCRGSEYHKKVQVLSRRYHVIGAQSPIKDKAPSGGVLILIKKSLGVEPLGAMVHRRWGTGLVMWYAYRGDH